MGYKTDDYNEEVLGNRTEGRPIIRWATFRPWATFCTTNGRKVARLPCLSFSIHCTYSSIDLSLSFNFIFWLLIFCVDCFLKHPYKRFCFFIFFIFTTRDPNPVFLSLSLSLSLIPNPVPLSVLFYFSPTLSLSHSYLFLSLPSSLSFSAALSQRERAHYRTSVCKGCSLDLAYFNFLHR